MKKYIITNVFTENEGKHQISETFVCIGETELKSALRDMLDLFISDDGMLVEPDRIKLQKRLGQFVDDDFIRCEFEHMMNGWNTYCKIMKYIGLPYKDRIPHATYSVNENTTLTISVED